MGMVGQMKRQMIKIDEEKCNGCGLCVTACEEGALELVNGKAKLIRDDYCDGMGNCLPACPADAISFETREALPFNENILINKTPDIKFMTNKANGELSKWPIQLKLVPTVSESYNGADLLIAADCTAFASRSFHDDFIKGRVTVIGCPKFDSGNYVERLAEIFTNNDIKSVTVARMKVPCCSQLERMVKQAIEMSEKDIPTSVVILDTNGMVVV